MAQKIHPKSLRLGLTENWNSRWFSFKNLPQQLAEDYYLREFLKKKLKNAKIERIEIERTARQISIIIKAVRPGLIIGRGGSAIEDLKKEILNLLSKLRNKKGLKNVAQVSLNIEEVKKPEISASVVAQNMAEDIEKRIPYRRVLKNHLAKIMQHKEVKGAKVLVSGRLDGAEIARTEWLKEGRLPLVTLRSDIDYGTATAFCTYGTVGIKVWIYKGEKFS